MNEIDAIRQRHSVRQYKADRIEEEKVPSQKGSRNEKLSRQQLPKMLPNLTAVLLTYGIYIDSEREAS